MRSARRDAKQVICNASSTALQTMSTAWVNASGRNLIASMVSFSSRLFFKGWNPSFNHYFSLSVWTELSWWMYRLRQSSLWMWSKLCWFKTCLFNVYFRKKKQMPTGMFALTIMALNWEDVFMHATTMMLAKINAWTSSKLANSTALAR